MVPRGREDWAAGQTRGWRVGLKGHGRATRVAEDSQGRLWRDASFGGAQTRQKCSRERRVCGSRARVARTVMEIRASLTSSRPGDHCDVDGLWGAGGECWEAEVGRARPKGILCQIMAFMSTVQSAHRGLVLSTTLEIRCPGQCQPLMAESSGL